MPPAAVAIGSAVIGAYASSRAAKKQSDSADRGIAANRELIGPYSEAGAAGLPGVQSFVDEGARFSDTQAFKDITNSSKAGGQHLSGNRATALSEYYATNFRPQRLNELMSLPRLGANAAAGQATNEAVLFNAQGNAQAGGILGAANSVTNAANTYGFLQAYNAQNAGNQPSLNNSTRIVS